MCLLVKSSWGKIGKENQITYSNMIMCTYLKIVKRQSEKTKTHFGQTGGKNTNMMVSFIWRRYRRHGNCRARYLIKGTQWWLLER